MFFSVLSRRAEFRGETLQIFVLLFSTVRGAGAALF